MTINITPQAPRSWYSLVKTAPRSKAENPPVNPLGMPCAEPHFDARIAAAVVLVVVDGYLASEWPVAKKKRP